MSGILGEKAAAKMEQPWLASFLGSRWNFGELGWECSGQTSHSVPQLTLAQDCERKRKSPVPRFVLDYYLG
jgi:hypothetical protein